LNPPKKICGKLNVLDTLLDAIRIKKQQGFVLKEAKTVPCFHKALSNLTLIQNNNGCFVPKLSRFHIKVTLENSKAFVSKGILLIFWFRNSFFTLLDST